MQLAARPHIEFIPLSTDLNKIKFFGTLMPGLMLLKANPRRFFSYQRESLRTPAGEISEFIAAGTDDAARKGNTLVFVHRWQSLDFDPFSFARAKSFLKQLTRKLHRSGYAAQPLGPLSPLVNLPQLAASTGLGTLSPFGLLVHPIFGPRLILTGLKTDFALDLAPHWTQPGCDDCLACLKLCPQQPLTSGVVNLRICQSCAKCLTVCPVGKGKRARAALENL